jgi:hypothetical protein
MALPCDNPEKGTTAWNRKDSVKVDCKGMSTESVQQTPHELFNYCSTNIHSITLFCVQEEQILNYREGLAD